MNMKYFATSCEFTLHEADWNEGEGKFISRWDEVDCMESAESIEDVLEQVNYLDCDMSGEMSLNEVFENDPCQDKDYGRFDADLLVDINGETITKPTEEKSKQFERGEVKLYALHIRVHINKQADLAEDDIKQNWLPNS